MSARKHRPCYLRGDVAGAWLASVVMTVVAGLVDNLGWLFVTTGLLLIALYALSLDRSWSR
jgi:hypothetical protein